jgi:hypothetical protein
MWPRLDMCRLWSGGADAVATPLFGLVKALVGAGEDGGDRAVVGTQGGGADADRDGQGS